MPSDSLVARARALIKPITGLGWSVLACGAFAWLTAWWLGWEEMAVLGTACAVAAGLGLISLFVGKAPLSVALRMDTQRVIAGDPAATTVVATNDGERRMLPIRLETRVGRGMAEIHVPALGRGESHEETFSIRTDRRSVIPVGPVRSVRGDPLGLVRREVRWTGVETLYVHPKKVRVPALSTGWLRDLEGETTNDRSPSDVAFHTLREYVVGDDRRHIHWRTTARQADGRLMVREFVDTRRARIGVVVSMQPEDYASDDELELAVSIAASIGTSALADGQDLTCLSGRQVLPTYSGMTFLDALAGVEPRPGAATCSGASVSPHSWSDRLRTSTSVGRRPTSSRTVRGRSSSAPPRTSSPACAHRRLPRRWT
jgi:uncharacterized protein (DUF58 family)